MDPYTTPHGILDARAAARAAAPAANGDNDGSIEARSFQGGDDHTPGQETPLDQLLALGRGKSHPDPRTYRGLADKCSRCCPHRPLPAHPSWDRRLYADANLPAEVRAFYDNPDWAGRGGPTFVHL